MTGMNMSRKDPLPMWNGWARRKIRAAWAGRQTKITGILS